jgi:hypothetical protein
MFIRKHPKVLSLVKQLAYLIIRPHVQGLSWLKTWSIMDKLVIRRPTLKIKELLK